MLGKPVVIPIDTKNLRKEKIHFLDAVNIIKKKRYSLIKGRTCANDIRQKNN